MQHGLVVYGCDQKTYEKAKKEGKAPRLIALSQVYACRSAAEQFMRLAGGNFCKMEVREK